MPTSRPDLHGLEDAWRALRGLPTCEGWQATPVIVATAYRVLAAMSWPAGSEAILVAVPGTILPPTAGLPSGRGFLVEALDSRQLGVPGMALSRQDGASTVIFRTMCEDFVGFLADQEATSSPAVLTRLLLGRIQAWQDFMSPGDTGLLELDEEVGLVGELNVLEQVLALIPDARTVLEGWDGPRGGLHDFLLGTGAIEVKTTVAQQGFRARIGSLEQLDATLATPLCLAAVRLGTGDTGSTLPEHVERLAELVSREGKGPLHQFETRLLQAGYHAAMAEHYTRRFTATDMRVLPVDDGFPCLTRRSVPDGVVGAGYTIDLDVAERKGISMAGFLVLAGLVPGR